MPAALPHVHLRCLLRSRSSAFVGCDLLLHLLLQLAAPAVGVNLHSLFTPWRLARCRLCVSITDFGIRVLAMPGGKVLHNLSIHTSEQQALMGAAGRSTDALIHRRSIRFAGPSLNALPSGCAQRVSLHPPCLFLSQTGHVHVLECHPIDPALAFSASYDGTVAVWDVHSGQVLRRFSRSVGCSPAPPALVISSPPPAALVAWSAGIAALPVPLHHFARSSCCTFPCLIKLRTWRFPLQLQPADAARRPQLARPDPTV